MKYIALLAVLLMMGWTWQMAQAEREFGVAESREMEAEIETVIRDQIMAERPGVKSVTFQKLFTEILESGRLMQVHARYTIEEETKGSDTTRQLMEGLVRLKSTDGVNWQFAGQELKSPGLEFKNGIRIEAQDEATRASDAKTPETTKE